MATEPKQQTARRERVIRTLTFWLRPEFVLRVVSRFQKLVGFDRSIALASPALTATIPLLIVTSAVSSQLGGKDTAQRIIDRYELGGGGAEAVQDIFSPPGDATTSIGILGVLFLLIAVLSFTRTVQRLFEQCWELEPLSVKNTVNGLLWIVGLAVYTALGGVIHAVLDRGRLDLGAALAGVPLAVVFLVWSGRVLSAKRIARPDLMPFGVIGAVAARGVLGRRDGVRAAPVQHVCHPLRRDRRRLRHDLDALLHHVHHRRLRRGRPRGQRRARPHPPGRTARRRRRQPPVGHGDRPGAGAVDDVRERRTSAAPGARRAD